MGSDGNPIEITGNYTEELCQEHQMNKIVEEAIRKIKELEETLPTENILLQEMCENYHLNYSVKLKIKALKMFLSCAKNC